MLLLLQLLLLAMGWLHARVAVIVPTTNSYYPTISETMVDVAIIDHNNAVTSSLFPISDNPMMDHPLPATLVECCGDECTDDDVDAPAAAANPVVLYSDCTFY